MASINIIRYQEEADPIKHGNEAKCSQAPLLNINLDNDGFLGKLGKIIFIEPNINNILVSVFTKANTHVNPYGETIINNKNVIVGDIIWLSSQLNPEDNGIYQVTLNEWNKLYNITDNIVIDLGASAYDPVTNTDITRSIITSNDADVTKIGMYNITYYVINNIGILTTKKRKIVVREKDASISPVGGYTSVSYNIEMG